LKRRVHLALKYLLGLGTLGYGLVASVQPQRLAALTGMEEDALREQAMRDIGSGIQILTANGTSAFLGRAFYDLRDAVKLRSRPLAAGVALAWALLAIAALLTRPGRS
jgi:hypothetical protein